MVEFSLTFPIFIILVIGLIEFAVAFNALLAINFASRDAALLAAEAGSDTGADCVILSSIEDNVTAPANTDLIGQVEIYWANQNGTKLASNVYARGGTTTCTYPDGTTLIVGFTLLAGGYPEADRCDVLAGCGGGHNGVDTIGVEIGYTHAWVTPLAGIVTLTGTGFDFSHSNAMRMEPVL